MSLETSLSATTRTFTWAYVAYLVTVAIVGGGVARWLHERMRPLTVADMARPDYVDQPDRILRKIDRDGVLLDLRPNTHTVAQGVAYETNADGQRDDVNHALAKTPGRTRVVFLGDSFTFGWGVELQYTFVKQLQSLLGTEHWELINLGVPAYATPHEVQHFLEAGLKYAPDLVILMYHPNDAGGLIETSLGSGMDTLNAIVNYYDGALSGADKARVETFLRERGYPLDPPWYRRTLDRQGRTYLVATYIPMYWSVTQEALKELEDLSHEHGFKVLVGILPALESFGSDYFDHLHAFVAAEMRSHGFGVVDLKPVLARYPKTDLMLWGHDGHTNAFADRIIAQVLADRLTGGR